MASIAVNYAAMASGHDGLVATWSRIEGHLAELDAHVAGTADMTARHAAQLPGAEGALGRIRGAASGRIAGVGHPGRPRR